MIDEPHFLLVGDSRDIPAISGMLTRLPVGSFGQVYLEVASAIQMRRLPAPDRVSVTWLCRDRQASASGAIAPRGELAARAAAAWVSEWMPEDSDTRPHPYIMWIGCSTSAPVSELYRRLADRLGDAHLHHPHY
ncbi:SIP domain-containing protein [Protaetiibacter intestinalis]|uniref:SIP-like Rossmann fold domain-containing protein n=1 Tax=Protaetiibacter intestinalis TaxID=2419774 RepID=A0A387B8N2_9MICO|nr:SIP domain-containing protein [Protaetiibacter intestinalis]AYF98717.1 hypothetical protein D7I47_10960 [Protaetiibacter intestinalis]